MHSLGLLKRILNSKIKFKKRKKEEERPFDIEVNQEEKEIFLQYYLKYVSFTLCVQEFRYGVSIAKFSMCVKETVFKNIFLSSFFSKYCYFYKYY